MADDLEEAMARAERLAAHYRARATPRVATWLQVTVYVLEGCDCLQQGGTRSRYHVHPFDRRALAYWQGTHADLRIVATYPA